jgi:hypothetical protein
MEGLDEYTSFDPNEGDLFFPFYTNYLQHESHGSHFDDPHERLTLFYLAIQELIYAGKHALAFGVYQDLVTKKGLFHQRNYPCQEELSDMLSAIVHDMRSAGVFASLSDLR